MQVIVRRIMVYIVKNEDTEDGRLFIEAVSHSMEKAEFETEYVAFDCEGINLSRIGSVELISICFSSLKVFLIDFGGTTDRAIEEQVRRLFESDKIIKIIHDCRMDSDALFHRHHISLTKIHDTSCFHHVISGQQHKSLNDVLAYNGIATNAHRDKNVYATNPNFWAVRPLTPTMINWATSDVDKLFGLANIQRRKTSENQKVDASKRSNEFASSARSMKVAQNLRVKNPGPFIGRGGANIQSLQRRTGTIMYQKGPRPTWFVYYPNESALAAVKRAMDN
jgi:ribonuclease D